MEATERVSRREIKHHNTQAQAQQTNRCVRALDELQDTHRNDGKVSPDLTRSPDVCANVYHNPAGTCHSSWDPLVPKDSNGSENQARAGLGHKRDLSSRLGPGTG